MMAKYIQLFGLILALPDVASEFGVYVTLCPFLPLKPTSFLSDPRKKQCLISFSIYSEIDLINSFYCVGTGNIPQSSSKLSRNACRLSLES